MRRALLLAVALLAACAEPDARPDLVLVVVDTLRADHLSAYGYHRPTSPRLEELAAEGVLFEDATAQSSWTRPSMVSMLTGRHVFVNAERVPGHVDTLAERLSAAGYETVALVANPAVSEHEGFHRGFDHWLTRDLTGGVTWDAPDLERVLYQWLAEHPPGDAPRFYYLHYMDPHDPYDPDAPRSLPGEVELRNDVLEAWTRATTAAGAGTPIWEHFDRDRRHVLSEVDAYDREIAAVDASLARVLARLDATRPAGRERFVVFAADHGEGLWNHRHHPGKVEALPEDERTLRNVFWRDHSYHLFSELIATPLVAVGPGLPAGERVATPVENVDVVPTLLRAAGLPVGDALDGVPLQDVAAGTAPARDFVFAHCNEGTAVRDVTGGKKLVFPTDTGFSFGMPIQLYDLTRDPHERTNLYDAAAPDDLETARRLIELREQAIEHFDLYGDESFRAESDASRQALEELGYLGGR